MGGWMPSGQDTDRLDRDATIGVNWLCASVADGPGWETPKLPQSPVRRGQCDGRLGIHAGHRRQAGGAAALLQCRRHVPCGFFPCGSPVAPLWPRPAASLHSPETEMGDPGPGRAGASNRGAWARPSAFNTLPSLPRQSDMPLGLVIELRKHQDDLDNR